MSAVSVVVITKDEADNIVRCLESTAWADEIIVVDTGSTDETMALARAAGATVLESEWLGFGPTKAWAVNQAAGPWILALDADEEVSPGLAGEIRDAMEHEADGIVAYDFPRRTRFLGRWIKHCGWYPDRILRLFRKDSGNFNDAAIHERVVVDGHVGHLRSDLLHHCYPSLEHYLAKSNRYTSEGAEQAYRRGRRASWIDLVFRPPASFLGHYLIRQGFRDGLEGFLVSALSAQAVLAKYTKLRALQNTHKGNERSA